MHLTTVKNTYAEWEEVEKEESELMKAIKARDVQWQHTGDKTLRTQNILDKIN